MLSVSEEWEDRFIRWAVHNGLRRRSYYAVRYSLNSSYSRMGSGCEVVKFMTKAACDRFIAEHPIEAAADYLIGGRQAISGRDYVTDKAAHDRVLAWQVASEAGC